jgi:hypothetical protein
MRSKLPELSKSAAYKRDGQCILSGAHKSQCERAYIVPLQMKQIWIDENLSALLGREAYFVETAGNDTMTAVNTANDVDGDTEEQVALKKEKRVLNMHHPMNSLCLREDLSWAWDNGEFVFMPDGDRWVAYFLDPTSALGRLFDHRLVRISAEVPKHFLMFRATILALKLAESFLDPLLLREEVEERMLDYPFTIYSSNPTKPLLEGLDGLEEIDVLEKSEDKKNATVEPERFSFSKKAKRIQAALKGKSKKVAAQFERHYPLFDESKDSLPGTSEGKSKLEEAVSSTQIDQTEHRLSTDNGEASQANHLITFDQPEQPEPTRIRDMQKVFRSKDSPAFDENTIWLLR